MSKGYIIFILLILLTPLIPTSEAVISPGGISSEAINIFTATPSNQTIEYTQTVSYTWSMDKFTYSLQNYTIYRNDTIVGFGDIPPPGKVTYNPVYPSTGIFEYTFVANFSTVGDTGPFQTTNNSVYLTVLPLEAPQQMNETPAYAEQEIGTLNETLNWTYTDQNPGTYSIEKNGTVIDTGGWSNNVAITLNDYNVTVGNIYNYTIFVSDTLGQQSNDKIIIEVLDNPVPMLASKSLQHSYAYTNQSRAFVWQFDDNDLKNYTIYVNSTIQDQGHVPFNLKVRYNLTSLSYGVYNLTIVVEDSYNQTISSQDMIKIIDIVKPVFYSEPTDKIITYGMGISLTWQVYDDNPSKYTILNNGSMPIPTQVWSIKNTSLTYEPPLNLEVGRHNITIELFDTYGNYMIDTVWVTVFPVDTLEPNVLIQSSVYIDSVDSISGNWSTVENVIGSATITATLKSGSSTVLTVKGTIDSKGNINLNLSYTDITAGDYQWDLQFIKEGYQTQKLLVNVTVHKISINTTVFPLDNIVQGEIYEILFKFEYNLGSPTALRTDHLIMPTGDLSNREMQLTLSYTTISGNSLTEEFTFSTNSTGYGKVILPADLTASIQKVDSIIISSEKYDLGDNGTISVNVSNVKVISRNNSTIPRNGTVSPFYIVIVILLIVALVIVVGVFLFQNPLKSISALDHLDHLRSIQMVIISNLDGIPIFEESFTLMKTDSTMVAGLSNAISTFLDEFIENKEKGLEVIERNDLSIISHRTEHTVLTVVSTPKLPKLYHDEIIKAHGKLVDQIPEERIRRSYSTSQIDLDEIVMIAFHENNIQLNLLRPFSFSADNFKEYLLNGTPNVTKVVSSQSSLLKELNLIDMTIVEFVKIVRSQSELDDNEIAKLLLDLDKLGLIYN